MRNDPLLGRRGVDSAGAIGSGRKPTRSPARRLLAGSVAIGLALLHVSGLIPHVIGFVRDRIAVHGTAVAVRTGRRPEHSPAWSGSSPGLGNPAAWITADDYPVAASRAGQQGAVTIAWDRLATGRVGHCWILKTSGYRLLDQAACRAVVRRGRYLPLPPGVPSVMYTRRVVWLLPSE